MAALTRVLRRMFPAAASARIEHAWCGVLGVPRDWCASVTYNPASGLGWAGGYTGHGVAAANLAGRTLADLVTGEKSPLTDAALGGAPEQDLGAGARALGGRARALYALYRLADRLESAAPGDQAGDARVRLGEALGRVGDTISGIPH